MALSNAERQKAFRQRRNELARRATAAQAPAVDAEGDDLAFADLIAAHWRAGALGLLSHGDSASCPVRAEIMAEVSAHRFSLIDMLDVVQEAGAAWAVKRFEQVAMTMAMAGERDATPEPDPAAIPAPPRRRKRVT